MKKERPIIVCLCGSTRFTEAFQSANYYETLAGKIVLTVGCDLKSDAELRLSGDLKERLDYLHMQKIELADEILVLNLKGYVGYSTHREIAYALALGRPVRWSEPELGAQYLETQKDNLEALGKLLLAQ